jgi:phosphocarrier protein
MGLGAKCGQTLTVKVDGSDEEEASKAIEEFLKANL